MSHTSYFRAVILVIAAIFLFGASVSAQDYSVQVILNNPSAYLSDWQSRSNTASIITENLKSSVEVKILAQIYLNGELVAYTKPEKITSRTLPAGAATFQGEDLVKYSAVHFENNIDASTQRSGKIPDGLVCLKIQLVRVSDNTVLAENRGCATIISYTPPLLILPATETELCKNGVNNVIDKSNNQPRPMFTWTPTVPQPANFPVIYHFAIFEVLPGMEPISAFRGGRPVFTQNLIGLTQLLWPTDFFLPEIGKRYMWSVRAIDDRGFPLVSTYDGWSSPNYFTVTSNCNNSGSDTDNDGVPNQNFAGFAINKGNGISDDGTLTAQITVLGSIPFDVGIGQTVSGIASSNSTPLKYKWSVRPAGYPSFTQLSDYQSTASLFLPPNTLQAGGEYEFEFIVQDAKGSWAIAKRTLEVGGQNTSAVITIPKDPLGVSNDLDVDAFEAFYRNFKANHRNGHIAIELNGTHGGWVVFEPNDEPLSFPTFQKHIGNVKYDDISFKCGTGMSKAFYEWIQASFDKKHSGRKNGAVVLCDFDYKEVSRLNFFQALTTEIGMPALDAASKDAAKMTIKFKPESVRFSRADSGKDHLKYKLDEKIQKKWTSANFRLKIDGFEESSPWSGGPSHGRDEPSRQYVKVEPMTMSLKLMEDTYEETKKTGSSAIIPKLTIIFDSTFTQAAAAWHDKLMLDRKNNVLPKKTGTLTYLADDKTELFTVDFTPVGIPSTSNNKFEISTDGIRRLRVEMSCEDVRFAYLSAAAYGGVDAQVLPEQIRVLHAQLVAHAQPAVRSWITDEATKFSRDPKATDLTIRNDIEQRFAGQDLSRSSKEALEFLVLTEAANQMTQKDLSNPKETLNGKLDSLSEMGEMDMLFLQRMMDRKGELERMISNVMKSDGENMLAAISALKAS